MDRTTNIFRLRTKLYSLDKGDKPLSNLLSEHNAIVEQIEREGEMIPWQEKLLTVLRAIPQLQQELENVPEAPMAPAQRKKCRMLVTCHYCGKEGHKKIKCLMRKRKLLSGVNTKNKIRMLAKRKLPLQCCIEPGEAYELYDMTSFHNMYDETAMSSNTAV